MSQDHTRLPPTRGEGQGRALDREFAEELRERLMMIAADERLKSMHTHLNGEIRRFSTVIEIAAKCLGRPLSQPHPPGGNSHEG